MIEKPSLEDQITDLEAQSFKLHGRIIATTYIPDKEVLMAKRAKVMEKLTDLKLKQTEQRQSQVLKEIDELFRKHLKYLAFDVNGRRVELTEGLTTILTFRPCGHTRQFHPKEMMTFQRSVTNDLVLLEKWKAILSTNMSMECRFTCPQCKTEIAQKFQKTHRHSDSDIIGSAKVTLQKF